MVDLKLLPQQQLKVTPKQIAANYILQLSSLELQDVINQELQENPALDLDEVQVCPLCGQPLAGRVCLNCFGIGNKPYTKGDDVETEPLEGTSLTQREEEEDELDPIVRAEAEQTLAEYLSWNVRVLLPTRLHPVAEYLIGNLNDNGYLDISLEGTAKATRTSLADASEALKTIQGIEPWGIGARGTRECLLIQMEHLAEIGEEVPPHARAIVADHFRELGEHKFGDIAQALRITREEVQAAWDYIKENLNPFPAHAFAAGPDGTSIGGRQVALRPDVIIQKNEHGDFEVEVIESRRFSLRVNPVYRQLVGQLQAARSAGAAAPAMTDDERQQLREDHGIRLARRTVAKYREELQILPARLRKR